MPLHSDSVARCQPASERSWLWVRVIIIMYLPSLGCQPVSVMSGRCQPASERRPFLGCQPVSVMSGRCQPASERRVERRVMGLWVRFLIIMYLQEIQFPSVMLCLHRIQSVVSERIVPVHCCHSV